MRISDWSSDVCSSDLRAQRALLQPLFPRQWPGLDQRIAVRWQIDGHGADATICGHYAAPINGWNPHCMKPHIILSHGLDSSPAATKVTALAAVAEQLGFSHERPDYSDIDADGDRKVGQEVVSTCRYRWSAY